MDTAIVYSSGIVKKGEEIIEFVPSNWKDENKHILPGSLLITNKRLLFLKKAGVFSKGLSVAFSCSLGDIESISPGGLLGKRMTVTFNKEGKLISYDFACKNSEVVVQKLVGAKDEFAEEKTIEAKRVIIEEGNKDDSVEILKKRLARGEITLEEFHEKIQRT